MPENLLLQEQRQAQKQEELVSLHEIEYNTALIEEREQGVQEIQQDISQVNEMFQVILIKTHNLNTYSGYTITVVEMENSVTRDNPL